MSTRAIVEAVLREIRDARPRARRPGGMSPTTVADVSAPSVEEMPADKPAYLRRWPTIDELSAKHERLACARGARIAAEMVGNMLGSDYLAKQIEARAAEIEDGRYPVLPSDR